MGFGVSADPVAGTQIFLRDTSDNRLYADSSSNSVQRAAWQHIAWVWNGSTSGGFQIFVNGQPIPITTSSLGTFGGLSGAALPVRLGAGFGNAVHNSASFDGMIDHISLWHGALSPQEVLADYQATVQPSLTIAPAVRLDMSVTPGQNYQLQVSTDLQSWTNLGTPFTAISCTTNTYADGVSSQRFFRLELIP
jgi:hypothetical protein